jgi:hypothetical protein
MQCEQFENIWQQRLDAGEDPRLDEQLVAHSLICSECNELLEGAEYLLAMPVMIERPPVIEPVQLASPPTYRNHSARWPSVAAALVATIALTLWGRVWIGLADPQHTVASAQRAIEDSIAGANSARAAADANSADANSADANLADANTVDEVAPWVPSPLQLALRARETRYLLDNTDPLVLAGWRAAIWEHPPHSSEFWAQGLEPLTTSWEIAMQMIRRTLPLNWSNSDNNTYIWFSPLR